ncbi:MAG: hypothetical protein Kow00122_01900 [Thermoleophilia bacterium]
MARTRGYRVYLAEFLGTFALVLAGCGAIMSGALTGSPGPVGVALTFGFTVMVMVYALGHVSGAHINPAVTVAFAVTGHFPWARVGPYVVSQAAGAVTAAALLRETLGPVASVGATAPSLGAGSAVMLETALTAVLMLVIVSVATDARAEGAIAGVAIGATVGLEAMWAGPLTGASMNPARSLGPALVSGDLASFWIYLVGPLVGAVLGAVAYQVLAGRPALAGLEGLPGGVRGLLSGAPGARSSRQMGSR